MTKKTQKAVTTDLSIHVSVVKVNVFVQQEAAAKRALAFCAKLAVEHSLIALVDDPLVASQAGRGAEGASADATRELAVLRLDVTQVVVVVREGGLTL